jgi:hypothetical protein
MVPQLFRRHLPWLFATSAILLVPDIAPPGQDLSASWIAGSTLRAEGSESVTSRMFRQDRPGPAISHQRMYFEPNQGQTSLDVQFVSRAAGYTLFLSAGAAVLMLTPGSQRDPAQMPGREPGTVPDPNGS